MAAILLHKEHCEHGPVRPGDVVFQRSRDKDYPLHVGIFCGEAAVEAQGPKPELKVRSLPQHPEDDTHEVPQVLGDAIWSASGEPKNWRADIVGAMRAESETRLREVLLVAEAHADRLTSLDECVWAEPEELALDPSRPILDGLPLFVKGTCAQYVDYLYAAAKMQIVAAGTRESTHSKRIHPTTQLHAFWVGSYPLSIAWRPELAAYPACIEIGTRCHER